MLLQLPVHLAPLDPGLRVCMHLCVKCTFQDLSWSVLRPLLAHFFLLALGLHLLLQLLFHLPLQLLVSLLLQLLVHLALLDPNLLVCLLLCVNCTVQDLPWCSSDPSWHLASPWCSFVPISWSCALSAGCSATV